MVEKGPGRFASETRWGSRSCNERQSGGRRRKQSSRPLVGVLRSLSSSRFAARCCALGGQEHRAPLLVMPLLLPPDPDLRPSQLTYTDAYNSIITRVRRTPGTGTGGVVVFVGVDVVSRGDAVCGGPTERTAGRSACLPHPLVALPPGRCSIPAGANWGVFGVGGETRRNACVRGGQCPLADVGRRRGLR